MTKFLTEHMARERNYYTAAFQSHRSRTGVLFGVMTHTIICCALLSLAVPTLALGSNSCSPGPHALYSHRAITLDHDARIVSPDGMKTLSTKTVADTNDPDGLEIEYSVTFAGKTFTDRLPGFNGEVAWSPDSKAFAVTQTEGGGGLGSRVYVFYVDGTHMMKLDVSTPIEQDFGRPVKCEIPTPPNTGFISWKADSSVLLVAAEVVPVSICECRGTYRVYEVALPRLQIAKTYSQTEAKKQFWDLLGCELRDVSDECVQVLEDAHRKSNAP